MDKHVKLLYSHGLLAFNREKAVFDVLKYIVDCTFEERKDKSIITLIKGKKKYVIIVGRKSVSTKGDYAGFKMELSILEKNCMNEFALSVRSKKQLLLTTSPGIFFKYVLVPVLLEAYYYHGLKMNRLVELINKIGGEKKFLIFKFKQDIHTSYKNNVLSVFFNNAHFSMKMKKIKPNPALLDKNFELGRYQNNTNDAFFAGLPYTLKALNNENFDYTFNGEVNSLEQICYAVLDSLYNYLMIENV